jgi:hypothetical protein
MTITITTLAWNTPALASSTINLVFTSTTAEAISINYNNAFALNTYAIVGTNTMTLTSKPTNVSIDLCIVTSTGQYCKQLLSTTSSNICNPITGTFTIT